MQVMISGAAPSRSLTVRRVLFALFGIHCLCLRLKSVGGSIENIVERVERNYSDIVAVERHIEN